MYKEIKNDFYNAVYDVKEIFELVKILNCAIWNNEISNEKMYILSLSEIIERQLKDAVTKIDKISLEIDKM